MKLTIFANVLMASMMIFAVSCGKGSKGGSSSSSYYNPYLSNGVTSGSTATGTQAIANLNTYINAVETITSLVGPINVVSQKYSCRTKEFLGINFLPYQYCSYSSVSSSKYAVPNATRAAQNPALANLLTPPSGYTLGNVIQYGTLITVEHYKSGSTIETIQYTIMTNRHAVSNPVQTKNTESQSIEQVVYPTI